MAHKAMNSLVEPEVICGPLSLKASSTGRDGSSTVGSTRPSWWAATSSASHLRLTRSSTTVAATPALGKWVVS